MNFDPIDQIPALDPALFFSMWCDIPFVSKPFTKMGRLLSTGDLMAEMTFANIFLGWCEEALCVEAEVRAPFQDCFYPKYETGDSLELFIDTRDVKTAGFATRFCHHFVALPQEVQGIQVQEVTTFRSEDRHPLCDPTVITCQTTFERGSYSYRLLFPKEALHGYDPSACPRLGFTYKINRFQGAPQHFSVSSEMVNIAQQPSLWASLNLVRRKG